MKLGKTFSLLVQTTLVLAVVPQPSSPVLGTQQADGDSDRYGDRLPEGAIARLGCARLLEQDGATGVAFSPDGKLLASCGFNANVHLWDLRDGKLLRTLAGSSWNLGVAFSHDGEKVAAVSADGFVQLWDVASGKELYRVKGHDDRAFAIAFAPDGTTIATAGGDRAVRLWDVTSGQELLVFRLKERVYDTFGVAFSPDGTTLAAGTQETIYLWDLEAGGPTRVIENAHGGEIVSLAFTPDSKRLISSGRSPDRSLTNEAGKKYLTSDSQIHVWRLAGTRLVAELNAAPRDIGSCAIALSANGERLISSHYNSIHVWDHATGKIVRTIAGLKNTRGRRTHGLATSPDRKTVAVVYSHNKLRLWDTTTGEELLSATRIRLFDWHFLRTERSCCPLLTTTPFGNGTLRRERSWRKSLSPPTDRAERKQRNELQGSSEPRSLPMARWS